MKNIKTSKTAKPIKTPKKPLAAHFSARRGFKIAAICGLVLFIVAQLAFDVVVVRRLNSGDNTAIISLITQAVDNLNKPAAVDPMSGAVYFPEVRLKLPPVKEPYGQVLYRPTTWDNAADTQLQLTTEQAVGTARARLWSAQSGGSILSTDHFTGVFNEVPRLQACARGITILFSSQTAAGYGVKPENTKQLKDGRTLYFATDDVSKCGSSLNSFLDYVKQVESY